MIIENERQITMDERHFYGNPATILLLPDGSAEITIERDVRPDGLAVRGAAAARGAEKAWADNMAKEEEFYYCEGTALPVVRLIGRESLPSDCVHKKRKPGEFIIYFVICGEMSLREAGTNYHLVPGDFLILHPDRVHQGTRPSACGYYYIHVNPDFLSSTRWTDDAILKEMTRMRTNSLNSNPYDRNRAVNAAFYLPKYYNFSHSQKYQDMCQEIAESIPVFRNRRECYQLMTSCRVMEFLIQISRQFLADKLLLPKAQNKSFGKIYPLMNYLNTRYRHDISSSRIEELFQCNFDYINRAFKKYTRQTIFEYLTNVRIGRAIELMASSSMKMAQIAEESGFQDPSYFSKVFRRETGMSPSEYAQKKYIRI